MWEKDRLTNKISFEEVNAFLNDNAEESYKKFSSGLLPDTKAILGVRLPILRKYARQLCKKNWRGYIKQFTPQSFEETMLRGMIIGYAKDIDIEERLQYIGEFIPLIDNWSVCDSFCISLKFIKENQPLVWGFLQPYLESQEEFAIRFAVVILLDYYINDTYIESVIERLDQIDSQAYYVRMAVAWALSMCFVHYPGMVIPYLKNNHLDDFTYHKTLQKICESLQVPKEAKAIIKAMKRS